MFRKKRTNYFREEFFWVRTWRPRLVRLVCSYFLKFLPDPYPKFILKPLLFVLGLSFERFLRSNCSYEKECTRENVVGTKITDQTYPRRWYETYERVSEGGKFSGKHYQLSQKMHPTGYVGQKISFLESQNLSQKTSIN